jgi:hypothetical protein
MGDRDECVGENVTGFDSVGRIVTRLRPHLTWLHGGEARVLLIEADKVVLDSSTPSAPGSRIDGVLALGSKQTVRIKVHATKKELSGRFRIEGRPIDLRKEGREELRGLVEQPGKDEPDPRGSPSVD